MELRKLAEETLNRMNQLHLVIHEIEATEKKNGISEAIRTVLIENDIDLKSSVALRLREEFLGWGPVKDLVSDEEVTEIFIREAQAIYFEKRGQVHKWKDQFLSPLSFENFYKSLAVKCGISLDLQTPVNCGTFGDLRIHFCIPPLATKGVSLTLRQRKSSAWNLNQLSELGWCDEAELSQIKALWGHSRGILVVGNTGSGKTSVLNALIKESDELERLVVIEDTDEIHLPNELSTKMLSRRSENSELKNYDQEELVKQSLRMAPHRIIVGEVRGAEAKDLMLALSTGHSGGICTLHAGGAREALHRLEMLVQLGAPQWSYTSIRRLIGTAIQHIFVVGKNGKGQRRLVGLFEVTGVDGDNYLLDPLYTATSR